MKILQQANLQNFNTLTLPGRAEQLCIVENDQDLEALPELLHRASNLFVLGGGSNLVLMGDYPGLMLHLATRGKFIVKETDSEIYLRVAGGESWHDLVVSCVDSGWHGLENLALIPGSVGAAPVQNIGAYGVELEHFLVALETLNLKTGEKQTWTKQACQFGYRNSLFKQQKQWLITHVTLALSKIFKPVLDYPDLRKAAQAYEGEVNASWLLKTILSIRKQKLPDPARLPNAGSFFQNPVVSAAQLERLQRHYPEISFFKLSETEYKLAAAWMIEYCGWKGRKAGPVGIHQEQALVLVNYGGATGREVMDLALKIQKSVYETFGIPLVVEPVLLNVYRENAHPRSSS